MTKHQAPSTGLFVVSQPTQSAREQDVDGVEGGSCLQRALGDGGDEGLD